MLNSLVVFATQKANDFSSGAVTTIDREIIRFFNQLFLTFLNLNSSMYNSCRNYWLSKRSSRT